MVPEVMPVSTVTIQPPATLIVAIATVLCHTDIQTQHQQPVMALMVKGLEAIEEVVEVAALQIIHTLVFMIFKIATFAKPLEPVDPILETVTAVVSHLEVPDFV